MNASNEILLGLFISFTVPLVIVGIVVKLIKNSAKNEHIKAENTDLRASLDIYVDYHAQHVSPNKQVSNFKRASFWKQEVEVGALENVNNEEEQSKEVKDNKGQFIRILDQDENNINGGENNVESTAAGEQPISHNGFLPPKISTFQIADMPDNEFLNRIYASLGNPEVKEIQVDTIESGKAFVDQDATKIATDFEDLDWNHTVNNEVVGTQSKKFQWRLGRNLLHFKITEQLSGNLMRCEIVGFEENITLSHTSFANFSKNDTFAAMIDYQDDDKKEVMKLWKVTDEAEIKLININKDKEKIEFSWEVGQHFLHFRVLESFNDDVVQCEIVGTDQTVILKSDKLRDIKVSMGFAARINVDVQGNKEIIKIWGNDEKTMKEEYNWNFTELNGQVSEG